MPKVTVQHADKEFLCFLKPLKGLNSLSEEWREAEWKNGSFRRFLRQVLVLKSQCSRLLESTLLEVGHSSSVFPQRKRECPINRQHNKKYPETWRFYQETQFNQRCYVQLNLHYLAGNKQKMGCTFPFDIHFLILGQKSYQ